MDVASELDCRGSVCGDFNADGRVELIYEHNSLRDAIRVIYMLKNQSDLPHHWIGVHLRQQAKTASPIGAIVTAKLKDGRSLLQHNVTGHSVWGQHDNSVHFGLGDASEVESIEVLWPNGQATVLAAPAVDQYHVVVSDPK
jgi:hypothetical protein